MLTVASFECLRLLQSLSYRPKRGYAKILLTWYFGALLLTQTAAALFYAYGFPEHSITVAYFLCAVPFLCVKRKTPLKFTKRILRITAVQTALLFVLCYFVGNAFFAAVLPVITLVGWAVCLPLDNAIARRYLRKACRKLSESNVTVIAVTGSYGKTSVKDMLTSLLDDSVSPSGSCNTPLGIARFINSTDLYYVKYLVLEFGARQKGDITELCKLFKPVCGVITGVCPQHLSTFKSLENVVTAKRELAEYLPANGFCVLNSKDEYARGFADCGVCRKVLSDENIAVTTENVDFGGTTLAVTYGKTTKRVMLPQISSYVADTFVMCLQTALQLKQCFTKTVSRSIYVKQTPHRMELVRGANCYILDDGYNGSIAGVTSCCETLKRFECRKVVVTQGLVECGKRRAELNEQCGRILGQACSFAVVVGKNANYLAKGLADTPCKFVYAKNLKQAVAFAQPHLNGGILLFQNDLPA